MPATTARANQSPGRKPQRARMFKLECCGVIIYMSRGAMARAVPVCGVCGEKMAPGPKIREYERSKDR